MVCTMERDSVSSIVVDSERIVEQDSSKLAKFIILLPADGE